MAVCHDELKLGNNYLCPVCQRWDHCAYCHRGKCLGWEDPPVVCLVGSTRPDWKRQYRKVEEQLTHAGFVVVSVVWFRDQLPSIDACGEKGCKTFEEHRELLEKIHFKKIKMAEAVVLIHDDARGQHTVEEIKYAEKLHKPVVVFDDALNAVLTLNYKIRENRDRQYP